MAFLQGIILAKLFAPAYFGLWSILLLVLSYTAYAHFGLLYALVKQVPTLRGKGEHERIAHARQTVFIFSLVSGVAVGLVCFIASFFLPAGYNPELVSSLRLISAVIVVQQMYFFYGEALRAENDFKYLSIATFIFSFVSLVGTGFVLVGGLAGFFAGLFLAYVIALWLMVKKSKFVFRFVFDYPELKRLFWIGFPLFVYNIFSLVMLGTDRFLVALKLGATNLGYYSFALMAANFILYLPAIVSTVLIIRLFEAVGAKRENENISAHLMEPTLLLSCFVPLLFAFIVVGVESFLPVVFVKYLPGIGLVLPLSLGISFLSVSLMAGNTAIAFEKYRSIISYCVIASLIIALFYFAVGGTSGVALGVCVGLIFYSVLLLRLAAKCVSMNNKAEFMLMATFPIAIGLFAIIFSSLAASFFGLANATLWDGFEIFFFRLFVFGLVYLPVVLFFNRHYDLFSKLRLLL